MEARDRRGCEDRLKRVLAGPLYVEPVHQPVSRRDRTGTECHPEGGKHDEDELVYSAILPMWCCHVKIMSSHFCSSSETVFPKIALILRLSSRCLRQYVSQIPSRAGVRWGCLIDGSGSGI